MAKALVATFGFDIDFVVRRMGSERYDEIILLALRTGEGFDRVEKSYHLLAHICGYIRVDCKLDPVGPLNLVRAIYSTLRLATMRNDLVDLFLTGGPRALVVSALIAAMMLPDHLGKKINVIVEGEAFEYKLQVGVEMLKKLISLDNRDRAIVMALSQRSMTLSELVSATEIPRTSVFNRLNDLVSEGIVCRRDGRFALCDEVTRVI